MRFRQLLLLVFVAFMFVFVLTVCSDAQTDNTVYVKKFVRPGSTVAQGLTDAQNACNPDASIPCLVVFDPTLSMYQQGSFPAKCAQCVWVRYDTTNPFATSSPSLAPTTLTDGATITWAIGSSTAANATVTLGGNRTLNITGPASGGTYVLRVVQDGTGSRTLTLGTGCTWKVISGGAGALSLTATANATDVLTFYYDGTNCYANLGKNYN